MTRGGDKCTCSQQFNKYGTRTDCTTACEGDLEDQCGNTNSMNVFEIHTTKGTTGVGKFCFIRLARQTFDLYVSLQFD